MSYAADAILAFFKTQYFSEQGAISRSDALMTISRALRGQLSVEEMNAGIGELVDGGFLKWGETRTSLILTPEGERKIGVAP